MHGIKRFLGVGKKVIRSRTAECVKRAGCCRIHETLGGMGGDSLGTGLTESTARCKAACPSPFGALSSSTEHLSATALRHAASLWTAAKCKGLSILRSRGNAEAPGEKPQNEEARVVVRPVALSTEMPARGRKQELPPRCVLARPLSWRELHDRRGDSLAPPKPTPGPRMGRRLGCLGVLLDISGRATSHQKNRSLASDWTAIIALLPWAIPKTVPEGVAQHSTP